MRKLIVLGDGEKAKNALRSVAIQDAAATTPISCPSQQRLLR